ncbi:hypothetical protein MPH_05741 [Macrophomina phaseolina MS6]|uniref:Uncharacterized protein n=1 Tax=Macrophomina phaseolina (strain MS6) TaxID=1126212 RepID=K2R414_MACPH|nr:hypothetical protein MPH_05741 [Macrophomina phaseolina MS6]
MLSALITTTNVRRPCISRVRRAYPRAIEDFRATSENIQNPQAESPCAGTRTRAPPPPPPPSLKKRESRCKEGDPHRITPVGNRPQPFLSLSHAQERAWRGQKGDDHDLGRLQSEDRFPCSKKRGASPYHTTRGGRRSQAPRAASYGRECHRRAQLRERWASGRVDESDPPCQRQCGTCARDRGRRAGGWGEGGI